jgi:hypothetical protein
VPSSLYVCGLVQEQPVSKVSGLGQSYIQVFLKIKMTALPNWLLVSVSPFGS